MTTYIRKARVDQWKWVESRREAQTQAGLFDLSADIGEKNDLSAQKPDILKMVRVRYDAWQRAMDQAEPRGPFRDYQIWT